MPRPSGDRSRFDEALMPRASTRASEAELAARDAFYEAFVGCPIPREELLSNLGLFLNRQTLSRILFMHDLYRRIVDVHGIVVEFGCRWGQNLALFSSFRGMYEPFNHTRKIVGFDTFSGFPRTSPEDGDKASVGGWPVNEGYPAYLDSVLAYHQGESPLSHIKKYEIVEGDVTVTLEAYLREHPESIIALAYFDLDLYAPTARCIELIRDRVTKGAVLGFDELNWATFPGETIAYMETIGLARYPIRRDANNPTCSYVVVDDIW